MERKLIYNQREIPKDQFRYGLRASKATGCGWIATYNALVLLGYSPDPQKIIKYYEHSLPVINGNFGTFVLTPALLFKKLGFKIKVSDNRARFDEISKNSDVCLMFYHWRRKLSFGAHYVALEYRDGKYIGYNTYGNSKGPDNYGDSLEAFIKKRRYFGVVLIGIKEKV